MGPYLLKAPDEPQRNRQTSEDPKGRGEAKFGDPFDLDRTVPHARKISPRMNFVKSANGDTEALKPNIHAGFPRIEGLLIC